MDTELVVHAAFTQDLIEISLQSNESLDMLFDLIKNKIKTEESSKSYIFSLFCELVWLNSTILLLLRRSMQELEFKDENQKEVFISEVTLEMLTTLLIAKTQATSELNKFSYSLSLH
jgi:hypothetical protein